MVGGVSAGETVLAPLRAQIDAVDRELVALLARRVAVVHDVIAHKQREGIAARLPDRVEQVVSQFRDEAARAGCPLDLAERVARTIVEWTIGYEEQSLNPKA